MLQNTLIVSKRASRELSSCCHAQTELKPAEAKEIGYQNHQSRRG
jgi:hypothetical protein